MEAQLQKLGLQHAQLSRTPASMQALQDKLYHAHVQTMTHNAAQSAANFELQVTWCRQIEVLLRDTEAAAFMPDGIDCYFFWLGHKKK